MSEASYAWAEAYYAELSPGTEADEARLKRLAKWLKRRESITHVEALNRIAQRMGYPSWKHLCMESAK